SGAINCAPTHKNVCGCALGYTDLTGALAYGPTITRFDRSDPGAASQLQYAGTHDLVGRGIRCDSAGMGAARDEDGGHRPMGHGEPALSPLRNRLVPVSPSLGAGRSGA